MLHEILSFSLREALFNRLSTLFFITASVYFIRLFSSNIQNLLQHLLSSLIWCSLAQQNQPIMKIRYRRTSKRSRLCVYAKLAACSAATSPSSAHHAGCGISQAMLHQCWPRAGCVWARQHRRPQGKSRTHAVPLAFTDKQVWLGPRLGCQLQPSSASHHLCPPRVYEWHRSTLKSLGWEAASQITGIFKICKGCRDAAQHPPHGPRVSIYHGLITVACDFPY